MITLEQQGVFTAFGELWKEIGAMGVLVVAFFWKVWPWITSYADKRLAFEQERQTAQDAAQKSMAEALNNNTIAVRELRQLIHDRLGTGAIK